MRLRVKFKFKSMVKLKYYDAISIVASVNTPKLCYNNSKY